MRRPAEAWGPLIHEGEARARADSERGQQLEAARQRLRVLVEQAGEAPAEVVGGRLGEGRADAGHAEAGD